MTLYRKPHIFQVVPDTGMLDYCVALIVANLYLHIQDPEREEVPQEIADANHGGLQHFIWTLKQQKLILANFISDGSVNIYSKTRKRPIEMNRSLDLLAQSDTDDLLIYGHDLLLGDRYATNYLSDVICNAKRILSIYSSELTQIFPSVKLGTSAAEKSTGTNNKSWIGKALAITNRLALEKYQRGEREISARNTCGAVAIELAKDPTTHGTRGERTAGNIRTVALKGWKFIPPTGTNGTSGTKK